MSALSNQIEAGRAYIAIRLDKAALINGLADVGKRMRAFGASVQSFGSDMMRLSLVGAVPVAAAVNSFIKFDDQMRITGAIANTTQKQLESLTAQARYLGSRTAFTAQQVASGMTALARLGNTADNISKSIEHIMYLTRATGNEMFRLNEIAELTGNIMNQYGIDINQVSRVTDILTYGSNRAAQTVQDIGQAMRSVGGIANELGDSMEDTVTSMILLSNRGIKGELLGTALRKAYDGILSNEEAIQQFGVATRNAFGELRKPYMIIADLFTSLRTKTKAEQVKIAKEIFGLRGMLAGMSIGVNAKEISEIRMQLNRIHGLAKNTAEQMESGIGGSFRKLVSMAQEVGLVIGNAVETPLSALMRTVTGLLDTVAQFIKENKALVQAFVTMSAVGATAGASIMALGLAIKVVAAPFSALAGVMALFKTTAIVAFNALLLPINLVGKSLKGLTLAFHALEKSATLSLYSLKLVNGAINVWNSAVSISINSTRWLSRHLVIVRDALTRLGSALGVVRHFVSSWLKVQGAFENFAARGIRIFIVSMRHSTRAVSSFIKNLNLAKIATVAYHKVVVALKTAKAGLTTSFMAIKTAVASFVHSISIARIASLAYNGTIKLLKSSSDTLALATTMLRGAFISVGNASKVALAATLKGFVIAAGAVGAFAIAAYGVYKVFPKIQSAASSLFKNMSGWWRLNKEDIIDFGKTLYSSIQAGDMEGAFKLALAGVMKVFYSFSSEIIELFSDVRFNVLEVWSDITDRLQRYILELKRDFKYLWELVKHPFGGGDYEKNVVAITGEYQSGVANLGNDAPMRRRERIAKRASTNAFAAEWLKRGNENYNAALENAKLYAPLQKTVKELNDALDNSAAAYRRSVEQGGALSFLKSSYNAYTSLAGAGGNRALQKNRIQTLIGDFESVADNIAEGFEKRLKYFSQDRRITADERRELEKLLQEHGQALYMTEELRARYQSINDSVGAVMQKNDEAQQKERNSAIRTGSSNPYVFKYGLSYVSPAERAARALDDIKTNVKFMKERFINVGTVVPA